MTTHDLIGDLAAALPKPPPTREQIVVYVRELEDIPVPVLEAAVRKIIRTAQWFPTVAEIRLAAAEVTLHLPSEPEALRQIDARMTWARDKRGTAPPVHPLVYEALRRVGGWHAFRSTEKGTVIRGQFGRLYRDLRDQALTDAQAGAA
jgi:hypothetical protein